MTESRLDTVITMTKKCIVAFPPSHSLYRLLLRFSRLTGMSALPQVHMFNELLTCQAPRLLKDLDTYLGDKEWFLGNYVTWADFYWDVCSTTLLVLKPDLLDIYPRLASLRNRVQDIPAISAWILKRPQTKL